MRKFAKWLGGAVAALALGSLPANAQTPIKFTLDWVFQGPTSPFLVALEKGYYKAEGLDVTMDPGQGSAGDGCHHFRRRSQRGLFSKKGSQRG